MVRRASEGDERVVKEEECGEGLRGGEGKVVREGKR